VPTRCWPSGTRRLKTDAKQSAAHALLTAEQAAAVAQTLEKSPGVDTLAAPRAITTSALMRP